MPAQNIGVIDLLADTESFDEARLPISAEVDARWRGRAITGAGLLKIASTALLLTGEDAPSASLLTAGRRAFYFRTNSDGDVTELHVSLDGEVWKEVTTGGGGTFTQGTGIRITDSGDGTKTIAVTRPLTRAQQTRINQLTDDYINALIAAGDHWREHFTIRYSDRFAPIIGPRWRQEAQGDGTGHVIRIVPSGADLGVIQAVREGSKIQVRTAANVVVNVFTVESDPADPDADGIWEILGDWDQVRTFNDLTEYVLYFSESRHHAIETDDETTEGDGTPRDPVKVKAGGIRDDEIAGDLTDTQKRNVRNKIGSVTVTAAEDAPSNPLNGDLHIYTHYVQDLVDHERLDGTAVTTAPANTIFRWNATLSKWIYVIFVELQDSVVQDNHISASMTDNQQRTFRQRVGAVIVTTGSSAPSDPITGDVHIYDEDVTGLSDHYENNGTTARSTANAGDIFRHDDLNSKWILEVEASEDPGEADPINDEDIASDLSNTRKKNFRNKIGGERTTIGGSVPSMPNVDDIHIYSSDATSLSNHVDSNGITSLSSVSVRDMFKWNGTNWVRLISALELPEGETAEEIRDALQTLTGNSRLPASAVRDLPGGGGQGSFYEYANRTIVADADRDTDSEIAIDVDTGTIYDLKIARNSDLYHLPDVNTGVQVRVTQGLTSWAGRVIDRSVSSGLYTIKIDFHQRRGTFTTGETTKVEIGAIPINQRIYIYGENQDERFPFSGTTAVNHGITSQGLKQWKDDAAETFNGGIAFTVQDVNDASDIDNGISTNVIDAIIRIDEDVPRCRIKFKFRGEGRPGGSPRFMQIKKVDSAGDDGLVLAAQGYDFQNVQTDAELAVANTIFEADEQDIELSNGDQLYVRTYNVATSGNASIMVGYILLERQE